MRVSNADRVVFPEAGLTKGDVVAYYEKVADLMIVHLAHRPLTVQRFPKGLPGGGFMQKNAPAHYPDSIERFTTPKQEGGTTTYPVVIDAGDIAYLANQGTITFHVWPSRLPNEWNPDRIIFDLDPPEDGSHDVAAAARIVKELFDTLDLPSTPVATGSKGFHVVAPIRPTLAADRLSTALYRSAHMLAANHNELLTIEFRKENRKSRIFVDWMRNHPGATSVCPWSLRPRPRATVATPITWEELASTEPATWTLRTIDERLTTPDPLAQLASDPPDATAAIERLESILDEAGIDPEPFDRFRS